MLRAALTSRSWTAPQSLHSHSLIPRPAIPFGLEGGRVLHSEQVWVLIRYETSRYRPPCISALYESIRLKPYHPASRTLFANLVRANFDDSTSLTLIFPSLLLVFAMRTEGRRVGEGWFGT